MGKPSQFSFVEGDWIDGTPYRVARQLGMGGMGEVYEVDHTRTGTRRAVKLLRQATDGRGRAARRLQIEGESLSRIDHPNVVRVYELGVIGDGRPYFAMQLLEGRTLRALMRSEGAIGVRRAVHLIAQALRGLQAVHDRDIVHRDVKPTNLFVLPNDRIKVLDFGVAKLLKRDAGTPTADGFVLGTLRYMAPEQLSGAPVGPPADIYATGLVLFELIAARHPFPQASHSVRPTLERLCGPAPRLSSVAPVPLPLGLDQVVARALETDPQARFRSALDFECELLQCLGEPSDTEEPTHVRRTPVAIHWTTHANAMAPATAPAKPSAPTAAAASACSLRRSFSPAPLHTLGVAASVCALVLASLATILAIRCAVQMTKFPVVGQNAALFATSGCAPAQR